ncbi:MAG: hypothetical protein GXO87_11210 [Chlorobi bacterium]|nr:hypothetical protein [Chlorobiota bacterium]
MVLDLVVIDTGDGFSAEVPSINGCESWAHEEDEAIKNTVELLRYYLNLPNDAKIKTDKARKTKNKSTYKLVFEK